ncbi:MAG: hypothetical protein [Caudoviricetes sp.]|nr:MAG: hypothetical protein [Caudoviricetes sp.]
MQTKIPFRVSDGLDGADQRAINIGYPDVSNHTDGVNVQYVIDTNTLPHYDETRKYPTGFAVIFDNRVYYAKRSLPEVGEAAGAFNPVHWTQLRTDPNWLNVINTGNDGQQLNPGDYVSADPTYSDLKFILPRNPKTGDTIVIKDVSGKTATMKLRIVTEDKVFDTGKSEYAITVPKSSIILSYDPAVNMSRGGWRTNPSNPVVNATVISPTIDGTQLSANDQIFRRSKDGKITLTLPRYANDGDVISMFDLDSMTSVNPLTIKVHPKSEDSIEIADRKEMTFKTTKWGRVVYQAQNKLWDVWDGAEFDDWIIVRATSPASNIDAIPSTHVMIVGSNGEINFNLPKAPQSGDTVMLSLRNVGRNVKLNIKSDTADKIYANAMMLGTPRLNDVPSFENIVPTNLINYVTTGYGSQYKFVYFDNPTQNGWLIVEQAQLSFRASKESTVRDQPGLVYFATQDEVNKNHEQNPDDESAVTPKTLASKTATEGRRGIAAIATQDEVNAYVNDDKIITAKKLSGRTATESRTGIAEIATQDETNGNTDDERIVTPKKLSGRTATESRTGVIAIVSKNAKEGSSRTVAGTGVHDFNDQLKAVTPFNLQEKKASEVSLGLMYWATQTEANNGTEGNLAIRPSTLQARVATETRTGLARSVNMVENEHLAPLASSVHGDVFITPRALAARVATETRTGLSQIASQDDADAGTNDFKYISSLKLKSILDARTIEGTPEDGIRFTKSLWAGTKGSILSSTEKQRGTLRVATQKETNDGTLDDAIITPKKLNARTALTNQTGILRLATAAEAAAGVLDNVAITPYTMGSAIAGSSEWGATEARRGSVFLGALTNDNTASTVWQGNDTTGSTRALANYKHDFYGVSPRGLNTALSHYLPKNAKAYDTARFDNLSSSQFLRKDKSDSLTGDFSASKSITSNDGLILSSKNDKSLGLVSMGTSESNVEISLWGNETRKNVVDIGIKDGIKFISSEETDDGAKTHVNGTLETEFLKVENEFEAKAEIKYKDQTLDERFVNITGDKMTGNLTMAPNKGIIFEDNGNTTGVINKVISAKIANDEGYIAVGATKDEDGFLEIGTSDNGTEAIYARQRGTGGQIINSMTLLDATGNTVVPRKLSVSESKIEIDSSKTDISFKNTVSNKALQLRNDGVLAYDGKKLYHEGNIPSPEIIGAVNKTGDTMSGDLVLEKNLIISGELRIKVGNKTMIIRPNPVTETVSFDWE